MDPIGHTNDDFRETLTRQDIDRICLHHNLEKPTQILPEHRGNEKVCYHIDDTYFLAFGLGDNTRRNTEILTILAHIDTVPSPQIIGWSPEDAELHVSYMLMTRCPGTRLDALWSNLTHDRRCLALESLGEAMGKYHMVDLQTLEPIVERYQTPDSMVVVTESFQHSFHERLRHPDQTVFSQLQQQLIDLNIESNGLVERLSTHYDKHLATIPTSLLPHGFVHGEPWPEHFLMKEHKPGIFKLTGMVDFDRIGTADALHEMVTMYVCMLAVDEAYYTAFKRGYERWFAFPSDAEEVLRLAAIDFDTEFLLWLVDRFNNHRQWGFLRHWIGGHLYRLTCWLDRSKPLDRPLFRKDIGPW